MDKQDKDKEPKEQDSTTPGPTTGGMRSMGPQPGEPTLEEKLGVEPSPHTEAPKHQDDPSLNKGAARQGPPPVPPQKAKEAEAGRRYDEPKDSEEAVKAERIRERDRKSTAPK